MEVVTESIGAQEQERREEDDVQTKEAGQVGGNLFLNFECEMTGEGDGYLKEGRSGWGDVEERGEDCEADVVVPTTLYGPNLEGEKRGTWNNCVSGPDQTEKQGITEVGRENWGLKEYLMTEEEMSQAKVGPGMGSELEWSAEKSENKENFGPGPNGIDYDVRNIRKTKVGRRDGLSNKIRIVEVLREKGQKQGGKENRRNRRNGADKKTESEEQRRGGERRKGSTKVQKLT